MSAFHPKQTLACPRPGIVHALTLGSSRRSAPIRNTDVRPFLGSRLGSLKAPGRIDAETLPGDLMSVTDEF